MNPWLVGAVAGVVAIPVAIRLQRRLRTGAHRRDDERDQPQRRHLWILAILPVLALLLGHALAQSHSPVVAFAYCLGLPTLAALAAIDVDVHRLPDALTFRLVPVAVAIAALAGVSTGHWFGLLRAVLAGMTLGAAYLVLLLLSRGGAGLGLGDVKLAVGLGILLGWFSWSAVLGATLAGFILGGLWSAMLLISRRATRQTYIAFGPFMIGGAVLALLGV